MCSGPQDAEMVTQIRAYNLTTKREQEYKLEELESGKQAEQEENWNLPCFWGLHDVTTDYPLRRTEFKKMNIAFQCPPEPQRHQTVIKNKK